MYWQWNSSDPHEVARTTPVGSLPYPLSRDQNDQSAWAMGATSLQYPPTPLRGYYAFDGFTISLSWSSGETESWTLFPVDNTLDEIQLLSASSLIGEVYQSSDTPTVSNAGWGFGGQKPPFSFVSPLPQLDLAGLFSRFNAWSCSQEPVAADMLRLSTFSPTSTSVLRLSPPNHSFLAYLYPFPYSPLLAYQTSHDFNSNGNIQDDIGHSYSGLQIIDSLGKFRGAVFADASPASYGCGSYTTSALFYLN